ncbi:acyl carrier protein [Streptomyces xanthophaeus]|uniref:acyl carrier protein n=1 Tax=Streptomyces xanthophaeus TaxID=67385 RepID=UPI00264869CA|nr:acyl carrier protein [Streptomyces xanthophaeus]WKD32125.1 acyl carrier protein [Streptomyces xanthophaeus]
MTTAARPHSFEDIRDWLVGRAAFYLERPEADVDPAVGLIEYGLDSVYAFAFCGDIEDHYGILVEPTLAWDHPTVNAMAAHLVELTGAPR